MKRVHILERPMSVGDVYNLDIINDSYPDVRRQKVARLEVRRWRRLKHQLA